MTQVPANYIFDEIDFGVVRVGRKVTREYPINNFSTQPINFTITRSSSTNPIYYVFDFDKHEGVVCTGKKYSIFFTYKPNIPGENSIDYFRIDDTNSSSTVRVKGTCIGPKVDCSIKYLTFAQTQTRNDKKLKFQLVNKSKVPAIFQFDESENENDVFRIEPIHGTISANRDVPITVEFVPKLPGLYSKQLSCLILHHKPILVHLLGIFNKTDNFDMADLQRFPIPFGLSVGYKGYLNDAVTIHQHPPPVSLSPQYLDFKTIFPNLPCQILTTSITNHFDNEIEVKWENTRIFQIIPDTLTIPAKKSALYEVQFEPDESHRLYSTVLHAQVLWREKNSTYHDAIFVPIPISLRLIGHSFPNKQAWIPSISLAPSTIVLPVTIPGYPTWTSFMIKSKGKLPVLFKLLPPEKTKFLMKPMIGLIRQYQIIIVQSEIGEDETGLFVEKWGIELNGEVQRTFPIYVKAQVEVPSILIGDTNIVKFEPTSPYCQTSVTLPIKNLSNCFVDFEFDTYETFGIVPTKWKLTPNEQILGTWWCLCPTEGLRKYEIKAKLNGYNKEMNSMAVDVPVTVFVNCVYSELCSMPKRHDFGIVERGVMCEVNFFLYNLGESSVYYLLSNDCKDKKYILLSPKYGKCGSKEKTSINIQLTAHNVGTNCITIHYNNRVRNSDPEIRSGDVPIEVFRLEYTCYYPLLQITQLHDHNFGPLFTKTEIWEFFQIDAINKALANLEFEETASIEIGAPECEKKSHLFYAKFILENTGHFDTSLMYKREKNCDCVLKEITQGFTQRQKVYECKHREVFTMDVSDLYIMKNSKQFLTFSVKYSVDNKTVLKYNIDLTQERHIQLIATINTIPEEAPALSLYTTKNLIDLNYIYIGLREPPVQAFWMYNNTSIAIPYKLENVEIVKLRNENRFAVLACLNSKGFLRPFSRAPLLFKFWPIENKIYEVLVPLFLGTKLIEIEIKGYGTDQIEKYNESIDFIAANDSIETSSIRLSIDRILMQPMIVGGSSEQLLFIKNLTKTDIMKYNWKPYFIDGLVKVEFLNNEGVLQPKESHSVLIKVSSLSEPCMLRVFISCELINKNELINYENFKIQKQIEQENNADRGSLDSDAVSKEIENVKPPKTRIITIPLRMSAIGLLDKDTCLSLQHQMKQKPCEEISLNLKPQIKTYFQENRMKEKPISTVSRRKKIPIKNQREINEKMTRNVLECVVADAVFSDYFEDRLMELKMQPNPMYSQVKCPKNKKKVVNAFTNKLPLLEISELFDDVVMDSVHETFQLGPVMKNAEDELNK